MLLCALTFSSRPRATFRQHRWCMTQRDRIQLGTTRGRASGVVCDGIGGGEVVQVCEATPVRHTRVAGRVPRRAERLVTVSARGRSARHCVTRIHPWWIEDRGEDANRTEPELWVPCERGQRIRGPQISRRTLIARSACEVRDLLRPLPSK